MDALIGYSGFVGSTLLRQRGFEQLYRSTNIGDIRGLRLGTVVCAGAPAQKWVANREPEADRRKIDSLIEPLATITCERFILISTVDVFGHPIGVTETSSPVEEGLHAYGRHRRLLEIFAERQFASCLIVRLPGLVGPGLRKNIVFDFLHKNNLHLIDSRGVFQFYPMVNLWHDIQIALEGALRLVHLTAEPVSAGEIAREAFGIDFDNVLGPAPASYDMRSIYARMFGGQDAYQYSKRESLQAIRTFAQSERPVPRVGSGGAL